MDSLSPQLLQALPSRNDLSISDSSLSDDILDAFDRQCVPGELLEVWVSRETDALWGASSSCCGAAAPLTGCTREMALRFILQLTMLNGSPPSTWFDAVSLLDAYWLHQGGLTSLDTLPSTCVAVVALRKKHENCRASTDAGAYVNVASSFASWMCSSGSPVTETNVTMHQISAQEKAVVSALRWKVSIPSVHSWLTTLCMRFNLISRGAFSSSVDWVKSDSLTKAQRLLVQKAAGPSSGTFLPNSHRSLAGGLFALGLVAARLLPLETLRPVERLEREEWETLYASSQSRQHSRPSCALHPEHQDSMTSVVRVTAGCNLTTLQADAHAVLLGLQDMVSTSRSRATS